MKLMKFLYWQHQGNLKKTFIIAGITFLISCKPEVVLENVISFDTTMPVFLAVKALSSTQIAFDFSVPVTASSVHFDPPVEIDHIEGGQRLIVTVKSPLPEGYPFVAELLVADEKKNTLSVLTPFRARNDRLPSLRINEVRTEYSKPKVEYIELYIGSAGNLGALSVITALNGVGKPIYEFPPVEVTQGEYIVLHLRTIEEGCRDELDDDLSRSAGTETSPQVRDLWIQGNEERLRKTDGIALVNQDNDILDAVFFSEYTSGDWLKQELIQFSTFLAGPKAWIKKDGQPGTLLPQDSCGSSTTTTTRTICRDELMVDSNSARDWYVTVTGGATPGFPNRSDRYSETAKTVIINKKNKK
ncbi:hypothetical protein [Gracilinema caldarium]|uniref:TP-1001-like C-terminal domain-containing protein n=1 Tax=Gracilinema caldarium (strain ATCC 51460 / DSM 7334 / H1) TaxID=744872 RepID=F8EZF8_GRAC1|nr:hypothetical protein [Gracilinema caldarium]AEJ20181.1 hypothetical protein Spica_2054 [Gracilinema caldarium DSM 7334]